jgi:hypothetical protein
MSKAVINKFSEALKAAEQLPEDAQDALAEELKQRIAEFAAPQLTEAQRAEVKRRLALPRRHVSLDEVRALLRRYNPAL